MHSRTYRLSSLLQEFKLIFDSTMPSKIQLQGILADELRVSWLFVESAFLLLLNYLNRSLTESTRNAHSPCSFGFVGNVLQIHLYANVTFKCTKSYKFLFLLSLQQSEFIYQKMCLGYFSKHTMQNMQLLLKINDFFPPGVCN